MISFRKFCELNKIEIQVGRVLIKHGIINTTVEKGANGGNRIYIDPEEAKKLIEGEHYITCPTCKRKLLCLNKIHSRKCDPSLTDKYSKLYYERLKQDDAWTEQEENLLKEIYENNSKDFILSKFKRTWKGIRERTVALGLRRNKELIEKDKVEIQRRNMLEKHGVESSWQMPGVKEKIRQANLKNLGVEYPMQSAEVRDKAVKTNLERYGVKNVFQSEEIKEKIKKVNLERYGVENPNQNKGIRAKSALTNIGRYGVDNPFKLTDKVQAGMIKKYGAKSPLQVPEIMEKKNNTNMERYGATTPAQNPEIQKKIEITNTIKYGSKTPLLNEMIKQKIKDINLQKYGVANPAQLEEIKEKMRKTCLSRYGVEYSLQAKEVREKGYETAKRNGSFSESKEENNFLKYLKLFDPSTKPHERHPILGQVLDYYMPIYDIWVQFDGTYWHGKTKRINITDRYKKIEETKKRDQQQNENIPNLIRFWSDDVDHAIKNNLILELIEDKIKSKSSICHQFKRKLQWLEEDLKNLNFDPSVISAIDFKFTVENINPEITEFIKKYEWLGTIGVNPKWCFTARYNEILGGVVLINEPTAYSKLLGEDTPIYEALIQRGATASWVPKNLGSRLIMFSCKWMVQNTKKRAFIAYGDPAANELGIIYQACNFTYLGDNFGNHYLYRHPEIKNNKEFSPQSLNRTSLFKSWCKRNGIESSDLWFKENQFKDIKSIPEEIKKKWYAWHKKILIESEKIIIDRKHKYVLVLNKNKKEKKIFDSLKNYKSLPYPKKKIIAS